MYEDDRVLQQKYKKVWTNKLQIERNMIINEKIFRNYGIKSKQYNINRTIIVKMSIIM